MITPKQAIDARALLGWTAANLAERAAMSIRALKAFEGDQEPLVIVHKVVLCEVLELAGVPVVEGKPVTLKIQCPVGPGI